VVAKPFSPAARPNFHDRHMDDADPFPYWLRPPREGFAVEDLYRLTDLPAHTQLIDGSLVPRTPQDCFHMRTNTLFMDGLRQTCPAEYRVRREMVVVLGHRQALEPDVMVIHAAASGGPDTDRYQAPDVVLAVETVMPDSEVRDRERKPQLYAKAGIRHFWRVERGEDGLPAVYVYELDPATGTYAVSGIHHNRLKLSVPFDIDIDLTAIRR
jgi:Uma2 family endonuclease